MVLHGYNFVKCNVDITEGYAYIIKIIKDEEPVGYIRRIELRNNMVAGIINNPDQTRSRTRAIKIIVKFKEIYDYNIVYDLKESNHKVKEYKQLIIARIGDNDFTLKSEASIDNIRK